MQGPLDTDGRSHDGRKWVWPRWAGTLAVLLTLATPAAASADVTLGTTTPEAERSPDGRRTRHMTRPANP
jgi:hypothetical protein